MGSASREALEAAKRRLAAAQGVTLATGEQLLAASRAIDSSIQLRSVLVDSSVPADRKAGLLASIFVGLDSAAAALLDSMAGARWSSADELVAGIEEIGIRAVATASGAKAGIEDEIFAFGRAVTSDHELELAVGSKLGAAEDKAALVDALLAGKSSPSTLVIIRHLVQSARGRRIGQMLAAAAGVVADAHGATVATVTSAVPLNAAQLSTLESALGARYNSTLRINLIIDPTIVGGLRVQIGDDVIDGTVASRLADLRIRLAG
ncbi:F0F1 ATP synthase subunit delta [Homoserinibacter sp. GY 40078]|uniref:F0F1 ATP synthase subunit delta n=1 Tax=Homoserinibacter sp. GY 40078 TaxID=2603275 RepID=UPI0011CC21C2|nr:F0F1 ATP synthase subunit delta [Homoserinibacter sp. GY 40078]TXK17268.1 F0F1 ATP synthase subunit delta [Homoserinibacter sp. GY 40078]